MVIVAIDVIVAILYLLAILRLNWLKTLVIRDFREDQFKIDDFSVLIKDIPVSQKLYRGNPELLKAMLVTHLEEVLRSEGQGIDEMEDSQENESQIASVHFGLSSMNVMKYMMRMFEEVEKIAKLKFKMRNDPLNSRDYEK